MKTAKEVREAKTRIINQGKLIAELKEQKGWELLEMRMNSLVEEAKNSIIASESFEELRYRRGFYEGLNALLQEVDTIISKGKKQEQLVKK